MNQHFIEASSEENVILQLLAVKTLLRQHNANAGSVWNMWHPGLVSIGHWLCQLERQLDYSDDHGPVINSTRLPQTSPCIVVSPKSRYWEWHSLSSAKTGAIIHNVTVATHRYDAISLSEAATESQSIPAKPLSPHIPELREQAYQEFEKQCASHKFPTTRLHLHRLDELHVGQLYQMWLTVSLMEDYIRRTHQAGNPLD